MTEDNFQKIGDLQAAFYNRLYNNTDCRVKIDPPKMLEIIHDSSKELLEFAFGKFGVVLYEMTQIFDMNHPDLSSIFDYAFANDSVFSQQFIEFMTIVEYAKNNNLNNIFPLLGDLLRNESIDKAIVKKIESENYGRSYVRLIADGNERDILRSTKKMQLIDLQSFYKKGEESWSAAPDNFKKFLRYDSAYMNELLQAERKMRRYMELGCNSLASEIAKSIEMFRENMEQAYYGFNRITMTNAAVILAKSLNYNYVPAYNLSAGSFLTKVDAQLVVSRNFFKNFYFDPSLILDTVYVYEPKVYPFYELKEIASDRVLKVIDYLDKFPDANYKPIFDHFGVIVPSISYKNHVIKDDDEVTHDYVTQAKCQKELDKLMISKNKISPIIVGEKDGKCFFICYWT